MLAATAASADPVPRCKERTVAADHSILFTNEDLATPGGIDHDSDCLDLFLDLLRSGRLPLAHLRYDLKSTDLFPAIDTVLGIAKDQNAKLQVGFELPPGDASPEDRSELRVDLFGPKP